MVLNEANCLTAQRKNKQPPSVITTIMHSIELGGQTRGDVAGKAAAIDDSAKKEKRDLFGVDRDRNMTAT